MLPQRSNVLFCRSLSITIAFGAVVMFLLFSACSGRHKDMGAAITERDSLPVMDTKGVMTLISDSGVTRYRINTEEWLVFDRKNPPYWAFEKGVYLEKFDSVFNVDASIKSDTAYYYEKQKLWKLMSNVHIQNLKGESLIQTCCIGIRINIRSILTGLSVLNNRTGSLLVVVSTLTNK